MRRLRACRSSGWERVSKGDGGRCSVVDCVEVPWLWNIDEDYPKQFAIASRTLVALPVKPARPAAWLRESCKRIEAGTPPVAADARIPLDWSKAEYASPRGSPSPELRRRWTCRYRSVIGMAASYVSIPLMDRPVSSDEVVVAIVIAHAEATDAGEPGYTDPSTGLFVFTAAYLTARGTCCDSGCRHCPYGLR